MPTLATKTHVGVEFNNMILRHQPTCPRAICNLPLLPCSAHCRRNNEVCYAMGMGNFRIQTNCSVERPLFPSRRQSPTDILTLHHTISALIQFAANLPPLDCVLYDCPSTRVNISKRHTLLYAVRGKLPWQILPNTFGVTRRLGCKGTLS